MRRPPAAPAAAPAEHPPGQAGAGHHGIRAGAGSGSAENDELAATRWRPGGPAVAGRPYRASPLPGAVVARTGTGISHRRRRGAVPGRRYPGSRAVTPPPAGAWPRDGFAGAVSWLRLGLTACRAGSPVAAGAASRQRCLASSAGLCRAAGKAHWTVSGSAVTPAG